jgi:hypothetical protein
MDTPNDTRQTWTSPRLEYKGEVAEVLRNGGGKLSIRGGDPGEMRCQRGGRECRD